MANLFPRAVLFLFAAAAQLHISVAIADAPLSDAACDHTVRSVLDSSMALATRLPDKDSGDYDGVDEYMTLRTGYGRLLGDLAVTYAKAKCWSAARRALSAIERPGLKLEAEVHLIEELARQSRRQAAVDLYQSLHRSGHLSDNEAHAQAVSAIGKALVKAGSFEQGRQYFYQIEKRWNHLESPAYLYVSALLEAGQTEEAAAFLDHGVTGVHRQNGRRLLVRYLVEQRQSARARDVLQELTSGEPGYQHLLPEAAAIHAQLGDVRTGLQLARSIDDESSRIGAFVLIGNVASEDSDVRQALGLAADLSRRCFQTTCKYAPSWVAEAFASAGLDRLAAELISDTYVDNNSSRHIALSKVAVALAKRGHIEAALRASATVPGDGYGVREALAVAYGDAGDFQSALDIFANTINDHSKFTIAAAIATMPLHSDSISAWLDVTRAMSERTRAGVYQVMMAALARRGETEQARHVIEQLEPTLTRARALLGLAQGQLSITPGEDWLIVRHIL